MTRVALFSPYIRAPLHPRIESVMTTLEGLGFQVELKPLTPLGPWQRINLLTLDYFDLGRVAEYSRQLGDAELVYIEDMQLLPLAVAAKLAGKKVIYESLDHMVHWRFHRLAKRWPWLEPLSGATRGLEHLERTLANRFADAIVVNSPMLADYFGPRARLISYCSHLESLASLHDPSRPPALLYLGLFTADKGADDVLALAARTGLKLYVFGTVPDPALAARLAAAPNTVRHERLAQSELRVELGRVLEQHSLLGLSLVRGVHRSYELGEHNKDIDYLALGAPILGNARGPTKDKLDRGCGVLADDATGLARLIGSAQARAEAMHNAQRHYAAHYSQAVFEERMVSMLRSLGLL